MEQVANLASVPPVSQWVFDAAMRVNDVGAVKDGVVFVGLEDNERFTPLGTAFLLWKEFNEHYGFQYVVTAKHVIADIPGDEVSIRINRKAGDAATIKIHKRRFMANSDDRVDLAMAFVSFSHDIYDFKMLNLDASKLQNAMEHFGGVCLGDEVYSIGLYTSHYGQIKNSPVLRVGTVAALPDEPVRSTYGEAEGYLIDLRTIGGMIGAPVYLNPPTVCVHEGSLDHLDGNHLPIIGMLVGYHVVTSKDEDRTGIDERNTGLGVVVPIQRVLEIVNSEGMKQAMAKQIEEYEKKSDFRPASAKNPSLVTIPE